MLATGERIIIILGKKKFARVETPARVNSAHDSKLFRLVWKNCRLLRVRTLILCGFFFFICSSKVGKVETLINHIHDARWEKVETLVLTPSGNSETHREATILSLIGHRQSNGRSLDEGEFETAPEELALDKDLRVRVRLCLMTDHEVCGDYTEAEGKRRIDRRQF